MKPIILRIYYFTIAGLMAGLLAWYFYSLIGQYSLAYQNLISQGKVGQYFEGMLLGGLMGAMLGFILNTIDGVLLRSRERFYKGALLGSLSGLFGGMIGLCLAIFIYQILNPHGSRYDANPPVIIMCWMIFGSLLGLAYGMAGDTRPLQATIGGLVGGLFGGMVYAVFGPSSFRYVLFVLMAIGGLIGLAISIAASLQEAWLEVQSKGKLQGRRFDLSKALRQPGKPLIIGKGKGCHFLLSEVKTHSKHASLTREGEHFILRSLEGEVYVHNRPIREYKLKDMDKIAMGTTSLIYHEKRSNKVRRRASIRIYESSGLC